MARQKDFGATWWGEKWLEAFSDIDDSGRLARGKTYARNGSVTKKEIHHNSILAKVQGSRKSPYSVSIELKEFSANEKDQILYLLQDNPKLWQQLTQQRTLPREFYDILEEEEIHLFPKRWRDFKASCSCPDFAMPCKHIAAIIYSFSIEIDQNPFLVFMLHGFDLLAHINQAADEQKMATLPKWENQWTLAKDIILQSPTMSITETEISFAKIPVLEQKLVSLLSANPIFFQKEDFKTTFANLYGNLPYAVEALNRFDEYVDTEQEDTNDQADWFKIDRIEFVFDTSYKPRGTTIYYKNGDKHTSKEVAELLHRLVSEVSITEVRRLSPQLQVLFKVYQFALALLEKGAIIPTIWSNEKNEVFIRWQPALLDSNVNEVFEDLAQTIEYTIISLGIRNKKTGKYQRFHADAKEALLTLLGKIFISYIRLAWKKIKYNRKNDLLTVKIEDIFFLDIPSEFIGYQERDVPHLIRGWIGKFLFSHRKYVPILSIQELFIDEDEESVHDEEWFSLEILIEDKETQHEDMRLPLAYIFEDDSFEKVRLPIIQDLQILSEYLVEIKEIVETQGQIAVEIESERLSKILIDILPLIQILGIKVLLPKSLERLVRPKLSGSISSKNTKKEASFLKLGNVWDFNWEIALGNERISAEEFEQLIAQKKGLWKFKNQYILLDETEIARIVEQLKRKRKKPSSTELLQTALTETYEGTQIEMDEKVRLLLDKLRTTPDLNAPQNLHATLRPYQQKGYAWLYQNARLGLGSILADDMGLGKTLQTIAFLLKLKEENELDKPALVVVPTTLLSNWQREINKFAPSLSYFVYHGSNRQWTAAQYDIWLTTYGTLRSQVKNFEEVTWSVVVIDEAQAIKNPSTAQTQAIKKLNGERKIALSGTPVENRLSEYWSIFDFTNEDYLGALQKFRTNFSIPIERDKDIERADIFRKMTAPFILRRLKTDKSIIDDLPEKIEQNQVCNLTKEQTLLYENTVRDGLEAVEKAEGIQRRGIILQLMTALKQICNHPAHFLKEEILNPNLSGKTELLLEILHQIDDNEEKALIFTQYTQMGELLQKLLEKEFRTEVPFLHGGLSVKKRDEVVKQFQENENIPFMILSLKAGGTGLNLVEATHVVHFDLWWNPAVEAQATDRAYRIGQKKNVLVHRMLTQGTLEEKINILLQAKKEIANLAVSTSDTWITEMDNTEIRALFELR